MGKSLLLDTDTLTIAEQALRAHQAETASSGQAAAPQPTMVTTSAPAPAAHGASAAFTAPVTSASHVAEAAATAQTSAPTAMEAPGGTEVRPSSALMQQAEAVLTLGIDLGLVQGPSFSAAQVASAGAIMASQMSSGPLAKLDTQLAALALQNSSLATSTLAATTQVGQSSNAISIGSDGKEYVTIDASALDGNGATLLAQLDALGLQHGASYGGMASGQIAASQLEALASLSDLHGVTEAGYELNAGAVQSQAVHAERADTAQTAYGVDGSGLKIGVLSDSFNASSGSDKEATDIASGDLPSATTILHDSTGEDEGRAMAQLIHDIAPGAAIEFATANGGEATYASNILALASAGAQVLVDDEDYYDEPIFQNGVIAQAVNTVAANGVAYFSAAGNQANSGWLGAPHFETSAVSTASLFANLNGAPSENVQLVQFASGEDYLTLNNPEGLTYNYTYIRLEWNDPDDSSGNTSGSHSGPTSDLDLFVYDVTQGRIIGHSNNNNITNGDPYEFTTLSYVSSTDVVRVYVGAHTLSASTPPSEIYVQAYSDYGFTLGDAAAVANAQSRESSVGHANAAGAITVGAAAYEDTPAYGTSPPVSEAYSSEADNTLYYADDGTRLATPKPLHSVDLTAVDDVDNTFFGYDDDSSGHPNFAGTSAAAPNAAAVALLMLQVNAHLTPDDIRHLEMDSAIPMANQFSASSAVGYNDDAGAGLIQADAAVGFAKTGAISNAAQADLYGTHLADTITAGSGSVMIEGFGGADILIAGSGADTFVYQAVSDSPTGGGDIIEGFLSGTDKIDLRAVDDGTVFLVKGAGGSTTIDFDLVGGAYQGEIYSTAGVAVGDLLVNSGTDVYKGSITGTTASTGTDEQRIKPFSRVVFLDTDPQVTNVTATVALSAPASGILTDKQQSADGSSYNANTGLYSVTGSLAQVVTAIEGLVFTPTTQLVAPGSTETTRFDISFADGLGGSVDNASSTITVTGTTPTATVALQSIAGDGVVNASEAAAGFVISGTAAHVADGTKVYLTAFKANGRELAQFTGTVHSGAFTVDVPAGAATGLPDATYILTAAVAGATTTSRSFAIHETLPTVSISPVNGNNVIVNTDTSGVTITGATTGIADGTAITISVYKANGKELLTVTTLDSSNGFSLHVSAKTLQSVQPGSYTLTADVTDAYGNVAHEASDTVSVVHTFTYGAPPIHLADALVDDASAMDSSLSAHLAMLSDAANMLHAHAAGNLFG